MILHLCYSVRVEKGKRRCGEPRRFCRVWRWYV
nr:MAG TPA: hypothetical protein [Caudoviricetes sp.]